MTGIFGTIFVSIRPRTWKYVAPWSIGMLCTFGLALLLSESLDDKGSQAFFKWFARCVPAGAVAWVSSDVRKKAREDLGLPIEYEETLDDSTTTPSQQS